MSWRREKKRQTVPPPTPGIVPSEAAVASGPGETAEGAAAPVPMFVPRFVEAEYALSGNMGQRCSDCSLEFLVKSNYEAHVRGHANGAHGDGRA